jgi:hypothetical protein
MTTTSELDLGALRLPPNYGQTLGVKKVLSAVPICKPSKTQFFRARAGDAWCFQAFMVEVKETHETYVVAPAIAQILGSVVKPVVLRAAIDRGDSPFLIPVHMPGEDGRRNPWHESRAQGVEHSINKWVRIVANMAAGSYDIYEAQGALPDPNWPDCTPNELVKVAFRDKLIADDKHPIVQQLLGKA